jgi:hypothetical protein
MLKIIFPPWALLGVYRGVNKYNSDYKKDIDRYEKMQTYKKPRYFYTENVANGIIGVILYCNPILFPIIIGKEIYRLEVNIRGLNEEKEKDDYNNLW